MQHDHLEDDLLRRSEMLTASGRVFSLRHPRSEDVCIRDIAHHLARICRYGGGVQDHYSVAQHSVLVAESLRIAGASLEHQRWGLLHDAAEAYCGDIIRPLKSLMRGDEKWSTYDQIELGVQAVICQRFGLGAREPDVVHEHDVAVCMREQIDLGRVPPGWVPTVDPSPVRVGPWPFERARDRFLEKFEELFPGETFGSRAARRSTSCD